jgi:hypothetical protein
MTENFSANMKSFSNHKIIINIFFIKNIHKGKMNDFLLGLLSQFTFFCSQNLVI